MRYFIRALREAAKSWPLLLAAMLCSAGVAALWGANIAALFPIIEVTLRGESLQSWNERRATECRERLETHERERAALQADLAAGQLDEEASRVAQARLDAIAVISAADQSVIHSAERIAGSTGSCRWIPSRPCCSSWRSWWAAPSSSTCCC
jgi:ATP-binding cassette subfamily B protein/subfamily B ATP-binding cassette protein MsbA